MLKEKSGLRLTEPITKAQSQLLDQNSRFMQSSLTGNFQVSYPGLYNSSDFTKGYCLFCWTSNFTLPFGGGQNNASKCYLTFCFNVRPH